MTPNTASARAGNPSAIAGIDALTPPRRSFSRPSWRTVRRNAGLVAAVLLLVVMVAAALWAPLPHDPMKPDGYNTLQAPSSEHWFGTDGSGFDIFSRTIVAAKLDIPLALAGTLVAIVVGVSLGLFAGRKGILAEGLMRALDAVQAFPLLVLAMVVVAAGGPKFLSIIGAIVIVEAPRFMRLVRGDSLHLRESRFIEAAHSFGASTPRILFRHILPNVLPMVLVQGALAAGSAIRVIAALSFLGIGIAPPEASWGAMVQVGTAGIVSGQWWIALFPGIAIFLAIAAFNVIADRCEALVGREA